MTIACCVIVPEGVVLGADSTASMPTANGHLHYFNHNQKLFEIGSGSTMAMLTWNLGGLRDTSYRTLLARLDDRLPKEPPSVLDVAERWADLIWDEYQKAFPAIIQRTQELDAKQPHVVGESSSSMRTKGEEEDLVRLQSSYFAGFCIAGYCPSDRIPQAYKIEVSPLLRTKCPPIQIFRHEFWGAPNFIRRIMDGYEPGIRQYIIQSGKWGGTEDELDQILGGWRLEVPPMPIRDAIDYVYSSIHSTIKALKFSSLPQICGGPIEIAVITTDRPFRWVRHKTWDVAINEGDCDA
jgi:hypothetical protein